MAADTSTVIQAFDGRLMWAPNGATVPTSTSDELGAEFHDVGWLTTDGIEFDPQLSAEEGIKGWPRGEVILQPAATQKPQAKFTLAQHDEDALDWITAPDRLLTLVAEYRRTVDGDSYRLVLPAVKVTNAGAMKLNTSDLVSIEITVAAQRDDTAGYTYAFLLPGGTTKKY
jgi:hypothetical protein